VTAVLDEAADTTPVSARHTTTPRDAWRRVRLPVILGLVFVVVAVVQTLVGGTVSVDRLDPEAAGPQGGRALATLLRDHGVDVRRVEAPTGGSDTTVFVPVPALVDALQPGAIAAAAGAAELVIAEPGDDDIGPLRVPVAIADERDERTVEPACDQPDAVAAGSARMGGVVFGAAGDATGCYATGGLASFVEVARDGRRVTLLGSGSFMTNDRLGDAGNAALALRLLTRHPTLEWVYPHAAPPSAEQGQSLASLLPHRLYVLLAELGVAALLLALWRARRLGPVVVEPLPVVVRAAEAVEGRARLYESAAARGRAADALRAGLRDRLVRALGLAPDAPRETLVAAVTARAARDAVAVDTLLYGPPPADDEALVRLATELDRLDTEVRAL
jgi:hypothetical protein